MPIINSVRPVSPLPELTRLIEPGVLGYYTHFESTEIFALRDGHEHAVNILTILVAEEYNNSSQADATPRYLNPQRIKLSGLKNWTFGIRRYTRPIAELLPALATIEAGSAWQSCGEPLGGGKLTPMPFQFLPPDNGAPVALNAASKNNFWNGCHIFEWSDQRKDEFQPLFDDPPQLQQLTEKIREFVPITLAAISDRLGNLIVQLPVTVVIARFGRLRDTGDFTIETAWHPKATPRSLTATCALEHDGVVTGYAMTAVAGSETLLPMRSGRGFHHGFIWDDINRVVLAATGQGSFIGTIAFNIQSPDPEPRTVSVMRPDGLRDERRIGLMRMAVHSLVGDPHPDDNGGWTATRMYRETARKLAEERRFKAYKPAAGSDSGHQEALDDVRRLIIQYGEGGAWLWDPYLRARDLVETLFYCPYANADLRALTTEKAARLSDLRRDFDAIDGNLRGLRLEFRARRKIGWDFHDRFLIFPAASEHGALAWSLGASVNSVGKAHHILQQVDNGQLVMDAFVELWNLLSEPGQLVWKRS